MSTKGTPAVFIRHGHSAWNLADRFTGWTDIPLTALGVEEAKDAGRRLATAGFVFDEGHVSVLGRTRETVDALLHGASHTAIPIHAHWRLNERHYGALQGLNKHDIFREWGEDRARRWWRGYADAPPSLELDDPRHPRFDPRYAHLPPEQLPASESLRDCQARLLPYWNEVLAPAILAGRRLLVASHGNTLRALVMHLEGLSPEAMEQVEIPSAEPLIYRFGADMAVVARERLGP